MAEYGFHEWLCNEFQVPAGDVMMIWLSKLQSISALGYL
jgi:hypothetical protein